MQLFPRFLILTFFALNIIADADWPKFRGPSGEGIWECPNLPLKLDQTKKIKYDQYLKFSQVLGLPCYLLIKDKSLYFELDYLTLFDILLY